MTQKEKDKAFSELRTERNETHDAFMRTMQELRAQRIELEQKKMQVIEAWTAKKREYMERYAKLNAEPTEEGKWSKVRRFFLATTQNKPELVTAAERSEL